MSLKQIVHTLGAFGALGGAAIYFYVGWTRANQSTARRLEYERSASVDTSLANHVLGSRGDIDLLHADSRPIVVYIHRETCRACASLMPWWHDLSDSLETHGRMAVMIALDSMSESRPLGNRAGVDYGRTDYPVALARALGVRQIPSTLLVHNGKVIHRVAGQMRSEDLLRFSPAWREESEISLR